MDSQDARRKKMGKIRRQNTPILRNESGVKFKEYWEFNRRRCTAVPTEIETQ